MRYVFIFLAIVLAGETYRNYRAWPESAVGLKSESNFEKTVSQYATEYGVPPEIALAVMHQESSGNRYATRYEHHIYTRHGLKDRMLATSIGLMQVIPYYHLSRCGLSHYSELFDVEKNIECGVIVLAYCYDKTESWQGALKCYNGSSRYADKVLARVTAMMLASRKETGGNDGRQSKG